MTKSKYAKVKVNINYVNPKLNQQREAEARGFYS